MTPATSHPLRATRGAAVVLVVIIAVRFPGIERRFAAAVLAAADHVAPPPRSPPIRSAPGDAILVAAIAPVPRDTGVRAPRIAALGGAAPGVAAAHEDRPAAATFAPAPPSALSPPEPTALATGLSPAPASVASNASSAAAAAYARLAAGDRRGAVRLFDAALAGDDPRAATWRRQRDALARRWSGSAYSIVRGSGAPGFAREPVLGGSQSGGGIAFTPDPLDPRPFALTVRGSIAHDDGGRSSFAAVGLQWRPLPGVTVAAERLIAVGPAARNDWTARIAAGGERRYGPVRVTAYGEGGVIGSATYAAVQGRAATAVRTHGIELDPGAGVWSSVQHDRGPTIDRVDLGPGMVARRGALAAEVDYRWRVAGNAAPGSGPILTLSAAF